jgi:riboflavin kinase/FMN adenylyltransferase
VLTFDPHPAKVLAPGLAPPLICTPARRLQRIAAAGPDACLVEPFDRAFAEHSPESFVDEILVGALGAREVCVGYDFTFGKRRAGDTHALAELGRTRGFQVIVIEPVTVEGIVCSSTKVRQFVLEGRVEGAALLLGRDFSVEGEVVRGAGRGRGIGVPTANLRPETELTPAPGVYAGWAETSSGRFAAAINVGTNPTFGDGSRLSIEAHLVDYTGGELYGTHLELGFARRLRAERRFPSPEALVAQIREDVAQARAEPIRDKAG